jgi:hypothetical protein
MNPAYARVRAERNGLFPQPMSFRGKSDRTRTVRAARHGFHHRPRTIQIKRCAIVPTSRARVRQNCDCGMASLMRWMDREPFFNSIQFGYPPAKSIVEAVDDGRRRSHAGDDAEDVAGPGRSEHFRDPPVRRARITVHTAWHPKNASFPTDARLLHAAIRGSTEVGAKG